jgi:hypothetical protein
MAGQNTKLSRISKTAQPLGLSRRTCLPAGRETGIVRFIHAAKGQYP